MESHRAPCSAGFMMGLMFGCDCIKIVNNFILNLCVLQVKSRGMEGGNNFFSSLLSSWLGNPLQCKNSSEINKQNYSSLITRIIPVYMGETQENKLLSRMTQASTLNTICS